jgi:hypothetical protein
VLFCSLRLETFILTVVLVPRISLNRRIGVTNLDKRLQPGLVVMAVHGSDDRRAGEELPAAEPRGDMKLGRDVIAEDILGEEARLIDPEVERRVLRKIDMFLMPAMVIGKVPRFHVSECPLADRR